VSQGDSTLEARIKAVIVEALELHDVAASTIATNAPLFGEGLGLDSIDALELAAALEKNFGFSFTTQKADMKATFHSVASLAKFISVHATNLSGEAPSA
jgi:acyl carrier protein